MVLRAQKNLGKSCRRTNVKTLMSDLKRKEHPPFCQIEMESRHIQIRFLLWDCWSLSDLRNVRWQSGIWKVGKFVDARREFLFLQPRRWNKGRCSSVFDTEGTKNGSLRNRKRTILKKALIIAILLVYQHFFCYCNFTNHETKELFVLTANGSLVGTLITIIIILKSNLSGNPILWRPLSGAGASPTFSYGSSP